MRRAGILAGVLALMLAGAAAAHTTISGVVKDVDEGARIIVLEDGRVVRLDNQTLILVDNRPVTLVTLQPGTRVVIAAETPTVRDSSPPPARPRGVVDPDDAIVTGRVAQVDSGTRTIVLSDGRVIQAGPDTVVLVDGRSVELARVTEGDTVVVQRRQPVGVGHTAVVHRGEAAASPGRLEPWPADVPESEMMMEPQTP